MDIHKLPEDEFRSQVKTYYQNLQFNGYTDMEIMQKVINEIMSVINGMHLT